MKAILLTNILYKGKRYLAGEELNLDVVVMQQLTTRGLVRVDAETTEAPVVVPQAAVDAPKEDKATGKTPKSKSARKGAK